VEHVVATQAPRSLASWIPIEPTVELPPIIRTRDDGPTLPLSKPCQAVVPTSWTAAAISSERGSGIRLSFLAGMEIYSANAPAIGSPSESCLA
jgi:hypothetical protein